MMAQHYHRTSSMTVLGIRMKFWGTCTLIDAILKAYNGNRVIDCLMLSLGGKRLARLELALKMQVLCNITLAPICYAV